MKKVFEILVNLALIILAALPIIELFDKANGGFSPLLNFTLFVVLLFWKKIQNKFNSSHFSALKQFIILSIISSSFTQILVQLEGHEVSFSSSPIPHFLLALSIYLCLLIGWCYLLYKYNFSVLQVFLLTGIWGIIFENNFSILMTFNPLFWFIIVLIYGSIYAGPYILTKEKFSKDRLKPSGKSYIMSMFILTIAFYICKFIVIPLMVLSGIR